LLRVNLTVRPCQSAGTQDKNTLSCKALLTGLLKVLGLGLHWPHEPLTVPMWANHPLSLRVRRSLILTDLPSIPWSDRFLRRPQGQGMLGAKSFTPKGSQLLPRTTAELQPLIANDPLLRVKKAGSNAESESTRGYTTYKRLNFAEVSMYHWAT